MSTSASSVQEEHPSKSKLIALGLGQLGEQELADIDRHLGECAACCQVAEGVAPDTLLTLLRSAATETDECSPHTPCAVGPRHTECAGYIGPTVVPPPALAEHPRYRLGELLGVGGMGAVYKAEHLLMQRPVALKVLSRELIDKPETVERFRREVRAAARLAHPNIVAAFDAEQAGDVHFLAMEYVEGISLAHRCVEYGPLPVAEACSYARQAALALQHAHECGMVHRDIKPQNLMLTPGGQVKVLDFGLARFIMESAPAGALLPAESGSATAAGSASKPKPLTQTGTVMGTPDYIAPEQARDSHLADIRADIYSLGCTLYDMLAGHAPFPDGNAVQKVKAHLYKTPPPLRTLRRDVPVELARVIERMMAKEPAERYQTPAEVAAALTPFASSKPSRRKKWPLIATALGFIAALALGVVVYVQTDRGTIVIEPKDDTIAVMIEKAGGVKIVDQANKREYRLQAGEQDLPSGRYLIEVTEPLSGLDFQVKKFELKRGKEVRVTAAFVAKGDGQAKADLGIAQLYGGKPVSFWLQQFQDANPDFRKEAVRALGDIAQKNRQLIAVLGAALKDKSLPVTELAANALSEIGPEAVPALLEGLKENPSPDTQIFVVRALGRIGANAKPGVRLLKEMLKVNNQELQGAALSALAEIGPGAEAAIPAMIELLGKVLAARDIAVVTNQTEKGWDAWIQSAIPRFVYHALGKIDSDFKDKVPDETVFGKNAKEAKQAVLLAWRQAYDNLRKRYSTGAGSAQVGPEDGPLFAGKPATFWLKQLEDANPKFRSEAVQALGRIAKTNKALVPSLVGALSDNDKYRPGGFRLFSPGEAAAQALGALGREAIPALVEVLRDKRSANAMSRAADALAIIGPEAKAAVPFLSQLLKIDNEVEWRSPITALGRIGPEAKPAIPAMIAFFGDCLKSEKSRDPVDLTNTTPVPAALIEALSRIDPEVKSILPKGIYGGGRQTGSGINMEASATLWQQAYEALKKKYASEKLSPPDRQKEGAAGDAAKSEFGTTEQASLYRGQPATYWMSQFKDPDPTFRSEALRALGFFAQTDKKIIPLLVAYLKDKDTAVARQAAKSLGDAGPDALPALLGLLKDQASSTMLAHAAEAVGWIGPKAKAAVPLLAQALKVDDQEVRIHSLLALERIGEAKPALPDIIDSLGDFLVVVAERTKKDGQAKRPVFASPRWSCRDVRAGVEKHSGAKPRPRHHVNVVLPRGDGRGLALAPGRTGALLVASGVA